MPRRCCEWAGLRFGMPTTGRPRLATGLREFQWFCLEHIREFNRGWDYFAGMSQADIDGHRRADVTWHRPTWRYGTAYGLADDWRDVFGLFVDGIDGSPRRPPRRPLTKAEEMMARLGLDGRLHPGGAEAPLQETGQGASPRPARRRQGRRGEVEADQRGIYFPPRATTVRLKRRGPLQEPRPHRGRA